MEAIRTIISPERLRSALTLPDLTDAAHGNHAMQLLVSNTLDALRSTWQCAVIVHRAHPVVSIADNYELLGYQTDATARDARYTRYVSDDTLLRTHASAMIPSLLRSIAPARYDDVVLACIGLVYRRDSIDRLHVGEPHQLDLWRIAERSLTGDDLHEMVDLVVAALVPGNQHRLGHAVHPYTVNGLEVEALGHEGWVEIAECGLAAPAVLDQAGLSHRSGLAMGIGLDRALMLRKRIDDIRLLRLNDPRVAEQMLDLNPYQPVSRMPPVTRDLSIAVSEDTTIEEISDRVRDTLGEHSTSIEAIDLLTETPASRLPRKAAARIGMRPDQKNVLLRVTLRHPTHTLTSEEGNQLRDAIYLATHQGDVHQWASATSPKPLITD